MDLEILILLFAVAVGAGVIDAIAGGGGLITLPALLIAGLPPAHALATNKIQALASVASSAQKFFRSGEIDPRKIWKKALASAIGAGIGAYSLRFMDTDFLARSAPILLICIALFFLISRKVVEGKRRQVVGDNAFLICAELPIGFYDGFFGPGTGSLYAAAFVLLLGSDLRNATANTKVLNAVGSAVAALIFLFGGTISWPAAIAMAAGGIIGGQIGAGIALRWGAPVIRIALVSVSVALAVRLLIQQYKLAFLVGG